MPSIDRNSPEPFYLQVYAQIAQGIENGLYHEGEKLPSIRECARELGVSNTTIELAYQKLTSEGYVQSRRGSGYTICKVERAHDNPHALFSENYRQSLDELERNEKARASRNEPRYDFAYDAIDRSLFPLTHWARIAREVFFNKGAEQAFLYNDRQGLPELRAQISEYVNREYDVSCIPEQVLVMPTTRDLIGAIVSLFDPKDTRFAMADPGYNEVANKLSACGVDVVSITVMPYPQWDEVREVIKGVTFLFATTSSQFPTNRSMPLDMRRKLVEWAQTTGAYIIDDEYGWEFQSGVARMPALATLDHSGHTITLGTFSNSFSPSVSLSYAILPPQLMLKWQATERDSHPQVPWQTQAAMATFMADGHWRVHIRKTRTTMARKRALLLKAAKTHLGDEVEIVSGPTSLFVLMQTKDGRGEDELISLAETAGVRVYPTSCYWRNAQPDTWRYILVGFAGIAEDDIEPGIAALARAWGIAMS